MQKTDRTIAMKCHHRYPYILLFLVIMTLTSCANLLSQTIGKKIPNLTYTLDNGAVPHEFPGNTSTLLVVTTDKKSYNKYLNKHFLKYKGKYVILSREEIESKQYSDKKEYQYIFDFTWVGGGNDDNNDARKFHIQDRTNGLHYFAPYPYYGGFYVSWMKRYIRDLNYYLEN